MTSTHVNEQNFEAEVMKADKLVLIDFYADWCGPCKNLAPRIEEFAAEHPEVKVVKINVDESPNLAASFGVKSIPTLITMKDGVGLFGSVGVVPKSGIEKLVADSLQKLAPAPDNKGTPPSP